MAVNLFPGPHDIAEEFSVDGARSHQNRKDPASSASIEELVSRSDHRRLPLLRIPRPAELARSLSLSEARIAWSLAIFGLPLS